MEPSPKWDRAMTWQAGRRVAGMVPGAFPFGVPPPEGETKGGGGVYVRGRGGPPFLPEEVETCAVFPLRKGHANEGRRNPVPPNAVVVGAYKSDSHSTIHVPTGT